MTSNNVLNKNNNLVNHIDNSSGKRAKNRQRQTLDFTNKTKIPVIKFKGVRPKTPESKNSKTIENNVVQKVRPKTSHSKDDMIFYFDEYTDNIMVNE